MWENEKDFELLSDSQEHDLDDENTDDFLCQELEPSDNEDENIDVFDYEADFYLEEEDY